MGVTLIISETLYVIEGKVVLQYLENGEKVEKTIEPGNVVQVEDDLKQSGVVLSTTDTEIYFNKQKTD